MDVESGAQPSNTLSGELRSRPLAVLLAGACERGTSGTFTFQHGSRLDVVGMRGGRIAVVRTSEPVAYLGGILYELGFIDIETLNTSLLEVAQAKRLHGDVLVQRGAISHERRDEGLTEQTFRKAHHLFTLPEDATWTFRDDVDDLGGARDEDRPPVDTWQVIWRGLRDQQIAPHIRRTLAKVDGGIQLRDLKSIDRFGLAPDERAVCERLHAQPSTLAHVVHTSPLAVGRTELLVYLLALARCIVRIDAQPVGPLELGIQGVRERARRIDDEDPQTVLGVRAGDSMEAARAAYFRLARLWRPDKIPKSLETVRSECEHVFMRFGEAHSILTETHARRLAGGPGPASPSTGEAAPAAKTTMHDVDAALTRNDLEVADALARTLLSAGSDGPSARAVMAWCDAGAGLSASPDSLERALCALERVATGDPDCVRALYYRGQIAKRLGRIDAAQRDFRKVIRLEPRHVDALREVRLHEMRRRTRAGDLRASTNTNAASTLVASRAGGTPANANAKAPAMRDAPDAAAESVSVRSGLRRLIARVAGKVTAPTPDKSTPVVRGRPV